MADYYLEAMETIFKSGNTDLYKVAEELNIPFEAACLTFAHGILKGYWKIVVNKNVD